jgi:hypothetical protein
MISQPNPLQRPIEHSWNGKYLSDVIQTTGSKSTEEASLLAPTSVVAIHVVSGEVVKAYPACVDAMLDLYRSPSPSTFATRSR